MTIRKALTTRCEVWVFDDAEELSAKAALELNELIDHRGLSQTETAAITGMTQPKLSQVRRYKPQNISLERLMC